LLKGGVKLFPRDGKIAILKAALPLLVTGNHICYSSATRNEKDMMSVDVEG
jgi:hypothetical protein